VLNPPVPNHNLVIPLKTFLETKMDDLKVYCEMLVENLRILHVKDYAAHETALELATKNLEIRLDKLNELREIVTQRETHYTTKGEMAIRLERIDEDIRGLRESRAELEGKASMMSVLFAYLLGLVALVMSLIEMFHK